ncbi:MAG: extracellular solute-binding protein [Fusobacteriaceae bacterium]
MKKSKMIATIFSFSLIVACGQNQEKKENEKTLSVASLQLGKNFDTNWGINKKASEKLKIKLKSHYSSNNTDAREAYNLMLASNDLADIIYFNIQDLEKLGAEGGMIPLNNLIEENAPNIKKFMEDNPKLAKDMYAQDGKIYMIPTYYDYEKLRTTYGLFIRKDWLDKFNLDTPKNIEELEKVLTIFLEKDANGNGKKDEIGILARGGISENIKYLTSIFGARPYMSYYIEDDKVNFAPLEKSFKESIKKTAEFYRKGLIDPEIFTRGWSARDILFGNNQGAMTSDWFGSTAAFNVNLKDHIKGFNLQPIEPIEISAGNKSKVESRPTNNGTGWGISAKAKDQITAIKFMDWWFSSEGRLAWNYGIEGETYEVIDGKPKLTDLVLKNSDKKGPLEVLYGYGSQIPTFGVHQDADYEMQWSSEASKKGMEIYMKPGNMVETFPTVKYTPKEAVELQKINEELIRTTEEYLQKWILGGGDIDKEWDDFIDRLNKIGLEKTLEIQQKAYNNYIK